MKTALSVCVENAGRSQMAEAFANKYGTGKLVALGPGTKPAETVNRIVMEVMKEKGVDLSSKNLSNLT